jgi:hypothetical protein
MDQSYNSSKRKPLHKLRSKTLKYLEEPAQRRQSYGYVEQLFNTSKTLQKNLNNLSTRKGSLPDNQKGVDINFEQEEPSVQEKADKTIYEEYLKNLKVNFWEAFISEQDLATINIDEAVFKRLHQDILGILAHWKSEDDLILKRKMIFGASWDLTVFDVSGENLDFLKLFSKINSLINQYNVEYFFKVQMALRQLNGRLYFTHLV